MYHINPACTKSILRSMPKKEYIKELEYICNKCFNVELWTLEYYRFKMLYE